MMYSSLKTVWCSCGSTSDVLHVSLLLADEGLGYSQRHHVKIRIFLFCSSCQ